MRPILEQPEFDVVIIGSGIAGAMLAHRLALAKVRVLILEAGGVAPDSLGRWAMVHNYINSSSKAPDAPFCGDDVLPVDPKYTGDPKTYRFVQPNPAGSPGGPNYYDYEYDQSNNMKGHPFKSYYERVVGGSTWHWQGIYIRMLPNDFRMNKLYGVGFDWPISYDDLEPWYVKAEYEMGIAGSDSENDAYYRRKFGAYRSKRFPMPALVPSYLDKRLAAGIDGQSLHGHELKVNTVPHAINSEDYDGRPPCDGHTSCVPLCPTRARYEAVVHLEKALRAGAVMRTQAVVTKMDFDDNKKVVNRIWYRRWDGKTEDRASGRIVVLAANGIENPRILLSSGSPNPRVGWFLMDHPIKQSFGLAPQPLFPFRGPQTTSDIAAFRDGPFRKHAAGFKTSIKNDGWSSTVNTSAPRGASFPAKGKTDNDHGTILDLVENWGFSGAGLRNKIRDHTMRQITLNSACEQLPQESNRVTLSTKTDGLGIQRPFIQYRVDDAYTLNSFKTILDLHTLVFTRLGATDYTPPDDPNPFKVSYGGSGHIMGTTIMGTDPTKSVVDKHCRSHDHPNLFILGSSVFPTSSTANPTSTIAALTLRAAETIKAHLRS